MYGGLSGEKQGLLFKIEYREKGSFTDKAGRLVEYDAGEMLTFLNFRDDAGKTVKYKIAPERVQHIRELTEDICWGALVSLTLKNKQVVDLKVIADVFEEYIKG